jgi:hypothetical protein
LAIKLSRSPIRLVFPDGENSGAVASGRLRLRVFFAREADSVIGFVAVDVVYKTHAARVADKRQSDE